MIAMVLLVVAGLGVQTVPAQKDPAAPSRYGEWTGKVQTGMMAIGGETTGIRLLTGNDQLELAATDAVLAKLRELNGQQITIRGRLDTRAGVEIRTRRIITVTEILRPDAVARVRTRVLWGAFRGHTPEEEFTATIAALPADIRTEFNARYARRRALSPPPGWREGVKGGEIDKDGVRRELQAALTAYAGPSSAKEAAAYAKDAALSGEWEGYPDSPAEEAAFAEKYLTAHPQTPLRSYLELFLLYRWRAAFEAAIRVIDLPDKTFPLSRASAIQKEAVAKYRGVWDRVNASADPLTKALAADIDSALYIYLDVAAHPRK